MCHSVLSTCYVRLKVGDQHELNEALWWQGAKEDVVTRSARTVPHACFGLPQILRPAHSTRNVDLGPFPGKDGARTPMRSTRRLTPQAPPPNWRACLGQLCTARFRSTT